MNSSEHDIYDSKRKAMVNHLAANGIRQKRILKAFLRIPRHEFVPDEYKESSYSNTPLPIGYSQTISQPLVVAHMIEELDLEDGHKVLEIGTGSGYQTALLCELGGTVFTVEIIEELSNRAQDVLRKLGYKDVTFKIGDGNFGFSEYAPYDRIVVSAASQNIPDSLIEQLKENDGRMIVPVGKEIQKLILIKKSAESIQKREISPVKFVPLVSGGDNI